MYNCMEEYQLIGYTINTLGYDFIDPICEGAYRFSSGKEIRYPYMGYYDADPLKRTILSMHFKNENDKSKVWRHLNSLKSLF